MLHKQTRIDKIEILPDVGIVQIRQRVSIIETDDKDENPKEVSAIYHRYVLNPMTDIVNEEEYIKEITKSVRKMYSSKKDKI